MGIPNLIFLGFLGRMRPMEACYVALVSETNARAASFDDLAADGNQKALNVGPIDGA
jgi:hypothetical protein